MSRPRRRRGRLRPGLGVLPVVLGLLDGITNAPGMTAHPVPAGGSGTGLGSALRVASFALVTGRCWPSSSPGTWSCGRACSEAGGHLNLLDRGALGATRLGRGCPPGRAGRRRPGQPGQFLHLSPPGYRRRVSRPRGCPSPWPWACWRSWAWWSATGWAGAPVQWAAALAAGIVVTAVGAVLNIA